MCSLNYNPDKQRDFNRACYLNMENFEVDDDDGVFTNKNQKFTLLSQQNKLLRTQVAPSSPGGELLWVTRAVLSICFMCPNLTLFNIFISWHVECAGHSFSPRIFWSCFEVVYLI